MSSFIAKLETDLDLRKRAGKLLSNALALVSLAAVVMVGYLALNI